MIPCLPGYHVMPQDAGQMVTVSYAAAGPYGCLRRVYDASDRTARYTLHAWLRTGEFQPQNGSVACARRGRRITEQQAERLVGGAP